MRSRLTSRKRLLLLALLVLLAFALGACKRRQQLTHTVTTTEHTERQQGVSPRDTTLTVPAAQVQGSVPLPLPGQELPTTTVRSERAWSSVAVSNGRIDHAGGCDTLAFIVTLYDKWSREHSSQQHTEVQVERVTVEVTVIPKWVWWALAFGFAGLLRLLWPLLRKFLF